jgi:hypothetical protein
LKKEERAKGLEREIKPDEGDEKMADEDKNKKRSIWDMPHGTKLHTAHVVQLRHPNDPEVRELERKHIIGNEGRIPGKTYKYLDFGRRENSKYIDPFDKPCEEGVSKYIYEPYARYKRAGNPDYKRYRNYSLAGTLTGLGMLATGYATGDWTLAYAGAALASASFGYHSGHWWRKERTDRRFEKASSGLESLLEKRLFKEPEKDDTLYIKRAYKTEWKGTSVPTSRSVGVEYKALNEPTVYSGVGATGIALTSFLAFMLACAYYKGGSNELVLSSLYATGASAIATLGHYIGFILGKKGSKPEYQKVSGLEEKD